MLTDTLIAIGIGFICALPIVGIIYLYESWRLKQFEKQHKRQQAELLERLREMNAQAKAIAEATARKKAKEAEFVTNYGRPASQSQSSKRYSDSEGRKLNDDYVMGYTHTSSSSDSSSCDTSSSSNYSSCD